MPDSTPDTDTDNNKPIKTMASRRGTQLIAAIVLVLIGVAIGAVVATPSPSPTDEATELEAAEAEIETLQTAISQAEDRTWKLYRQREALQEQLDIALGNEGAVEERHEATEDGSFSDGIYLVDEDIQPGDYDGMVADEFGYWARLRATDGTVSAIRANDLVYGAFVLTIEPSDRAIELRGVKITRRDP